MADRVGSVAASVISFLLGAVLGVVAASNLTILRTETFGAALAGALVGGALAILGGLLGAARTGHLEREEAGRLQLQQAEHRERQELLGACVTVYTEMAHNIAVLKAMSDKKEAVLAPLDPQDVAFNSMQLVLAGGVPVDLLTRLKTTYGELQFASRRILMGRQQGALTDSDRELLRGIVRRFQAVQTELGEYMEAEHGYQIPKVIAYEPAALTDN